MDKFFSFFKKAFGGSNKKKTTSSSSTPIRTRPIAPAPKEEAPAKQNVPVQQTPPPPVQQTPPPPVEQTPPPPVVEAAPEEKAPVAEGQTSNPEPPQNTGATPVEEILTFARTFVGTPYLIGGTTPEAFDCSGFVGHVFMNFDVKLPRTSVDQANTGQKIDKAQARKGDLVFFTHRGTKVDHVGIVISDAGEPIRMIHASTSKGVIESAVTGSSYWEGRVTHYQRILS